MSKNSEESTGSPADARDEILTSQEVCDFLKIGRTKLWQLTRANVIPVYRLGAGGRGSLRYKRSEVLAWLERNRVDLRARRDRARGQAET